MPIKRMSFGETPDWLGRIGFINRLSFRINPDASPNTLTVQKGGLVFGFVRDGETIGYLVDNDIVLDIPPLAGSFIAYVTMDIDGIFRIQEGEWNSVVGIARNLPGIPWYGIPAAGTIPARALIGKVFGNFGMPIDCLVCDDAFWCEFEGVFQ